MKTDWPGMLCITFEKPIDFGGFFRMDMIGFSNYSVSDLRAHDFEMFFPSGRR
jgi:hypothetical protein